MHHHNHLILSFLKLLSLIINNNNLNSFKIISLKHPLIQNIVNIHNLILILILIYKLYPKFINIIFNLYLFNHNINKPVYPYQNILISKLILTKINMIK